MELDVGWVAKAGLNPVDVLRKTPGRFALCHLKDYDPDLPHTGMGEEFVVPGDGTLDIAGIREAAAIAGVRYGFIECDHPANTRKAIEQAAARNL
jgi:sugar phosphate isomerase/epimerase